MVMGIDSRSTHLLSEKKFNVVLLNCFDSEPKGIPDLALISLMNGMVGWMHPRGLRCVPV